MSLAVWFFFFNDTATTEIYTLSLHDALPILRTSMITTFGRRRSASETALAPSEASPITRMCGARESDNRNPSRTTDRKSTRLNSSHANISYAVFCLKKKQKNGSDDID